MSSIHVRRLESAGELAEVDGLYRRVFALDPADTGLNVRLLVALGANSGHVVGAFADDRLVGFGTSFLARDAGTGRPYQYSQTVAVAEDAQNRGVGRAIKLAQRDVALADGVELMRWVFDPMHARNAHFNLDVLGGRVIALHRDFYGAAAPRRDAGEPTDRCVVEWDLTGAPVPAHAPADLAAPPPGCSHELGEAVVVGLPADWRRYRASVGGAAAAEVRAATVETIEKALARGLQGAACRRLGADTAAYLFTPAGAEGRP